MRIEHEHRSEYANHGRVSVTQAVLIELRDKASNEVKFTYTLRLKRKFKDYTFGQLVGVAIQQAALANSVRPIRPIKKRKKVRGYVAVAEPSVTRLDLTNCDLRGVDFSRTEEDIIPYVDFSGSVFDDAITTSEERIIFEHCTLDDVEFRHDASCQVLFTDSDDWNRRLFPVLA